jgi:uncharacterized membrane protein YeaQ/YmgE (transglycosylase-associated protein family)
MFHFLIWVVYGLVVGLISKAIYRYKDSPTGFISTPSIGVCGSFVGGFISYLAGGGSPVQPSGVAMGVLGGVITSFLYRKLVIENVKKEMMK